MTDLTTLANHLDPRKCLCRAIIETPRGYRNKFDYDRASNLFCPGGEKLRVPSGGEPVRAG